MPAKKHSSFSLHFTISSLFISLTLIFGAALSWQHYSKTSELLIAGGDLVFEQINDHIVQTIIMLKNLPYPKHLADVPLVAGSHHEKMDGTSYPKRLTAADMPVTARIMAVADIFEALTASDRPYKKAKPLSEAIRIVSHMAKDQHINPELFHLFLSSGCYLEYTQKFLDPEQIDSADISKVDMSHS